MFLPLVAKAGQHDRLSRIPHDQLACRPRVTAVLRYIAATLLSVLALAATTVAAQLPPQVGTLLEECLRSQTNPPAAAIDQLQQLINRNDPAVRELFAREAARMGGGGTQGEAFRKVVYEALDRRQFALAEQLAAQVADGLGDGVEMVIRTGSSGSRHMQLNGRDAGTVRYDLLVSDDDISFLGPQAEEAAKRFNDLKAQKGLANARVKAFSLSSITDPTSYDLLVQQIRDPDAFVGAAGFGKIRQEIVEKGGAVIMSRQGKAMVKTAQTVQEYVARNAGSTLAEIMDVAAIAADLKQFGPMTMYASAIRQMGHAGVTEREQVKYLLRIYAAMQASGAFADAAGYGGRPASYFSELGEQLIAAYGDKSGRAAQVLLRRHDLITIQLDAFESVMLSTTRKLQNLVAQAEREAGAGAVNIARHPELRRMIHELAAGFALLHQTNHSRVIQDVIPGILKTLSGAGVGNTSQFYKVLYTAAFDAATLSAAAAEESVTRGVSTWTRTRTPAGLIEGMAEAGQGGRQARLLLAQVGSERLPGKSAEGARQLETILAESNGDVFIWKMLSNQTAQKFLIEGIALAPFAAFTMYQEWQRGEMKDLSDAAFVLIDFVPGGMTAKKLGTEGLTTGTVLMFAKEALYFSPLWPFVLTGDVLYLTWTMGGAIALQTEGEGIVDLLTYNGDFDESGAQPTLKGLSLPGGTYVARAEIADWLFQTRAVRVKHTMPGLEYYINNLSEKSNHVLDQQFMANDAGVQQMRAAVEQHLDAINWDAAAGYFKQGDVAMTAAAYFNYLAGFEFVVAADKGKRWAVLYESLKKQMEGRRDVVRTQSMVPQLIRLAEQRRGVLNAAKDLADDLARLQQTFEKMRGEALGVELVTKVGEQATAASARVGNATLEQRQLAAGQYWQAALARYQRILDISDKIAPAILERTGWPRVKPLGFKWTGNPDDDLRKAEQSKQGFAADLARILRDVADAKGKPPVVDDAVDRQAYALLAEVAFPWRAALDAADQAEPAPESRFFADYKAALEKVRALYGQSGELQALVDTGARIQAAQAVFLLDRAVAFELQVSDERLRRAIAAGTLTLKWSAEPDAAIRPTDVEPRVAVTTMQPEPVTVALTFEQRSPVPAKAALRVTLPVAWPDGMLRIDLRPATAKPGEKLRASAEIPDRFVGGRSRLLYRWSCANCTVDGGDRPQAVVTAPLAGTATVTVELFVVDRRGQPSRLGAASAQLGVGTGDAQSCAFDYTTWGDCSAATRRQIRTVTAKRPSGCVENPPPILEQACIPPTGPTAPVAGSTSPACSFEYSAWGECNRASKTQTRSVTSRKPAGCAESAKPALEQACTPPPTEEDKRNAYLNCLCRCSSGWAGHIGVWYDPEQKAVPGCKSSGPCIGGVGAFGCSSRHYFVGPNDCAKGCWESAFGKDSYDAAKADKMRKDENKKFKQPLKVKIAASKNPADFGDIVELTATATEGSGGYHDWNWGGCAQDAKETQAKVLNSRSCNACQATVSVTDNDGDTASDSLTIQCTALKVKLTKESPKENRIPVGGQAKFYAEVFSGDKPAGGSFFYIWERNPDAIFGDPKNPAYETQGGSQSRNSAVFRKLGTTPVWVSVLKDIGGKKTTVGESEQIAIEVVSPKLTLAAEPKDALVGQEVKITVTEDPKMSDDLLSFWWEIAGDATSPGPVSNVPNSRAYSFKSKNDRPVTVTVHAKAKDGGDELGVEKITVTAKKPTVTVTGPKIAGPAPMIWKEGVGLVTVGQQIAEAQRVEFTVTVAPDPRQDLRYQWTVAPEGCSITAPASKETGVTCSKVGGYTMTATVKNADGAELGSGTGSLSVTISLADIAKGKQKDEASKKLVRAKELWGQKKFDEAATEALAAAAVDAALAAPVLGQFGTESKAMGATAVAAGDYAAAQKHYERALRINPADQDAKTRLQAAQARAARVAELKPRVAKVAQDPAIPAKNVLDQARVEADELATLLPGNAEAQGYRQRIQEKLQAAAARDEKAVQAKTLRDEGAALQQQGKLGEAIGKYRGSLALVPDRALEDHIRQLEAQLAAERQKQQQATALWNEGRALYDAGKPQEALAKFRDSVKLWPDAANQRYITDLEAKLAQNRTRAQQLRGEGEALQQQGRLAEAIAKFKESLTLVSDRALEDHIRQLETRLAADRQHQQQAAALWNEGRSLFEAGRTAEALTRFKDSLRLWPDAANQRYVADLEAQMAQQAQRKGEAQRLRDEGYGLQQQNRLPEAVRKYRESLALWPDPELEKHVRQIEAAINAAATAVAIPPSPQPLPPAASSPQPVIYENGNTGGVGNGPTRATTFTLNGPHAITLVQTYHWNSGRGAVPGTVGLRDATGRMWGPWAVRTSPGQGGVPNAYWNASPNVILPAGTYTVVDSDPSSWAQNGGSQGAGFVRIEGHAAGGRSYTSTPRDVQPVPATVPSTGATRVLSAVASAPSTQFKPRTVPAFNVDTTTFDKQPYLVTSAYEGALRIGSNQSVFLAGNAAGTAGWRVDNYIVVELEWAGGNKAFWIGSGDSLSRNGQRLPQVGPMGYDQRALDITAQIPRNVEVRVRISALDYGGVGFVSDVYLVVR